MANSHARQLIAITHDALDIIFAVTIPRENSHLTLNSQISHLRQVSSKILRSIFKVRSEISVESYMIYRLYIQGV